MSTDTRKMPTLQGFEDEHQKDEPSFTPGDDPSRALVWAGKSIVMRNDESASMDPRYVTPALYNSFHYSLLPRMEANASFVIGVTSARDGDGKTLVASNLAVSMSLAEERETVLVDLNMRTPRLHSVFALGVGPGLAEALMAPMIYVARTSVRHLHVMTLGNITSTFSGIRSPQGIEVGTNGKRNGKKKHGERLEDMTTLPSFRHVMQSLKQRFRIIIFDMPSIADPILPLNLTRQMDGVLFVVNSLTTTRDDIARASQKLGNDRLLGFVLNRVTDHV